MPDYAEMPQQSCSISAVTFGSSAVTKGATTSQFDNVGGFKPGTAPGGLLVQAPGLVLPMLWHRGTIYHLGQCGRVAAGATIPPLGSNDYSPGGGKYVRWWDAPNSWGQENFLVRRPRTLIIVADDDLSGGGLDDIETWVNANYAALAAVNVSVMLSNRLNYGSLFAVGMPLAESNSVTATIPNGDSEDELSWSLPSTLAANYLGGDCFVAVLMDNILDGPANKQLVVPVVADASTTLGGVSPWSLTTCTGTDTGPSSFEGGAYVNAAKAANDIAVQNAGKAKFKTFQMILYQYDQNCTSMAYLVANVAGWSTTISLNPDPIIPDTTADSLLDGSTITRKTFAVNDLTSMLAQLLADAVAFFPAVP